MIANLLQDVRYSLRQLRKTPGFTLTAVLTLALGIGANTAIFTLVHAILLKNLPVVDPSSLVRLGDREDCCNLSVAGLGRDQATFSYLGYKHLRDHTPEFAELAAMQAGAADLSVRRAGSDATPQSSLGEFVSGNYFQTLGIQPLQGRMLLPSDDNDGAPAVAVITYQAWQRNFGSDPSVIGNSFVMNTHPVTIVGIAPQTFYGDRLNRRTDFFLPLSQEPTLGFYAVRNQPEVAWLFLLGRVKPDVALGPLQAKVSALLRQPLAQLPEYKTEHGREELSKVHVVLSQGGAGVATMQHQAKSSLSLLMGLSGLVLLIACANMANLVLVRSLARRGEISIRMALGAARQRVMRQMMTESVVLAFLGGLAGLALAYAGTQALMAVMFDDSPMLIVPGGPSLPVLGFAFALALLTGLIFGTVPAWITSRSQPINAMRSANRTTRDRSGLLQRSLVVLQASLSLVLLVGAGLLGKSLNKLEHQDLGLETSNRVVVSVNPLKAGYKPEQLQALYRQMEDKLHAMPDVEHVGLTLYSPLEGNIWSFYAYVQGQPIPDQGKEVGVIFDRASPDFFQAVGQRLVRGRTFTQADTPTSENVAVVNQGFVKAFFKPGEDPIGQHFGYPEPKSAGDFKIVGVVDDTRYENVRDAARPMFFLPMLQQSRSNPPKTLDASLYAETMVLQMKVLSPGLESRVRQTLASIDPNLTVDHYQTFAHQIAGNLNAERMITRFTLLFGLVALLLASVGLYGVTSYMVAQRTAEIGIRMALGADRLRVIRMILRSAMVQAGIGLGIGIPTALLCVRFVKSQLYNVSGEDGWVLAGAVLAMALSTCVAGLIPARRAASIDPMRALRSE